ncbi:CLEC-51 protein [Aphelenchoides avenae]|nr:CLEC-51 protein [Aphelenchus avenae]
MSEQPPQCIAPEVILYSCGSGWTYFEKTAKCYKRLKSVSFHEARSCCQQMDSSLTSIHSIEENNFLEEVFPTGFMQTNWIGLYTESFSSYKLKRIDGTPVDYVKYGDVWSPAFSGIGDRGGCYVMSRIGSGGRWALSTCNSRQYAICSKASQHLYNTRHI